MAHLMFGACEYKYTLPDVALMHHLNVHARVCYQDSNDDAT